jgi:hypothetical protein
MGVSLARRAPKGEGAAPQMRRKIGRRRRPACASLPPMTDLALPTPPTPRAPPWGTAASLGLHLLFVLALLVASPLRHYVAPPPAAVSVEIVSPEEVAHLATPAPPVLHSTAPAEPAAPAPAASAAAVPPSAAPAPSGEVTHRATTFYAKGILDQPGMARLRKSFGTLASSEKLVQLCNIEGLEQIRRAAPQYAPDTLVPYAMSGMDATALGLTAAGAAFRSRRKWYGVSFQCDVAADYSAVTAFSFTLGAPIPEDQWDEHFLNAEDADE